MYFTFLPLFYIFLNPLSIYICLPSIYPSIILSIIYLSSIICLSIYLSIFQNLGENKDPGLSFEVGKSIPTPHAREASLSWPLGLKQGPLSFLAQAAAAVTSSPWRVTREARWEVGTD
jgi:hypothetical protein